MISWHRVCSILVKEKVSFINYLLLTQPIIPICLNCTVMYRNSTLRASKKLTYDKNFFAVLK
jgi:hypothetical protein